MTASVASDFVLAADIPASGQFIAMGRMYAPCAALVAAAQDLRDNPADPDLLEIQVYALASNASGLCILDSGDIENVLRAWLAARLVADWRIGIPGVGLLQALYAVARFEPVQDTGRTFTLELRLEGKPEFNPSAPWGTPC